MPEWLILPAITVAIGLYVALDHWRTWRAGR